MHVSEPLSISEMSLGDRLALKNRLRNSYPSLTFLNPMAKYRFPCKVYLTSRQFGTATSLLMSRSARYRSRTLLYRGPKRTSVKLSFLRRSSLSFSSVRETVLCSGARPPHVSVMNLACALKSPLPINSPARLNMSPPCPVPKSCQISFRTFTWNEAVRSSRYGARYQYSSPRLLAGSYPILARKAAIGIAFISSIVIDVQF